MSNDTLWADSLKNADYTKITEFAQNAPKVLTKASMEKRDQVSGEVVRGDGLLLTKKQVVDLHRYEVAALALPSTLKDVVDYLAYGAGQDGGTGLKAEDFLHTFVTTREHAKGWSPLRSDIMLVGAKLKLFGSNILIYGNDVQSLYNELKSGKLLDDRNVTSEGQLQSLKSEMGTAFPGVELEKDTIKDTKYNLAKILKNIKLNLEGVEDIKNRLNKFGVTLREIVVPAIKLKVSLINTNSYPPEVDKLKNIIDERMKEIEIKNKQYEKLVKDAIASASSLNIVGLAVSIYYGVEAEKVRAARKKLNNEQKQDIDKLNAMNQTLGSLKRVEHHMQELTIIAVDADLATKNLMHVWTVLHLYVEQSSKVVDEITDALSFRRFKLAFAEVVSPWENIKNNADKLINVFKDAELEYGQTKGLEVTQ